jgi:hypothetical protein
MSNPWIRGAPTVWPHGPGQSPDALTALANGQALGMGKLWAENIGLATPLGDLILPPWRVTTGSGSVAGTISRYLIASEDGPNAALIDQITVSTSTTAYYFRWRSLQSMLGNSPHYCSILVYNQSGQALSAIAGNHVVQYASESYA